MTETPVALIELQSESTTGTTPDAATPNPVPFEHRLFTKKEVAAYFAVTERTIEIWMRRRYIPYLKIGQTVRFRLSAVLRYVDEKFLVAASDRGRRHGTRSKQGLAGTTPKNLGLAGT